MVLVAILVGACASGDRARHQALPRSPRHDALDEHLRRALREKHVPGAALAIVHDGVVVKASGYGLASVELGVPVTPETVFEIASLTKQFTAAAILLLVEDGRVALDDPLRKFIEGIPDRWASITVRHLLTHTAGLGEDDLPRFQGSQLRLYPREVLLEHAMSLPLEFEPGSQWRYSDIGYYLLGVVIERASGQDYRDFLRHRIFEPLGMSSTDVLVPRLVVKNRAGGYGFVDGKLGIRNFPYIEPFAHYGMVSSVLDLAKWAEALESEKLLRRSSLEKMWTSVTLGNGVDYPYGLGWYLRDHRGYAMQSHGGSTGTYIARIPELKLTVILLSNLYAWDTPWQPWIVTREIAGLHEPRLLSPTMMEERPDPEPVRTEAVKQFISGLSTGEEPFLAAPELRARFDAYARRRHAELFRSFTDVRYLGCDELSSRAHSSVVSRASRSCYYEAATPSGSATLTLWLDGNARVVDLLVMK